jgi:ABC-2 type transport system permease protein
MVIFMKKYFSFFRLRFIYGLQYRAAAFGGIITQFLWGGLTVLLYKAYYEADSGAFSMGIQQVVTYTWLQQAFLALFMLWFFENDIFDAISNGNIAYEITRPVNLYNMWFTKNVASRLSKAVLRCMPVLILAAFVPEPYGITLPPNIGALLWFLVTMIMGTFVVVAFCMLVYIVTFYTLSSLGVKIVASSVVEFLAGAILPLPFFPEKIQNLMEILPFAAMQNVPLRAFTGNLVGAQLHMAVGLQVFWCVALVGLGKYMMRDALKKVVVQGG